MTTVNFLDVSLHTSTFPSTYVPNGLLQSLGVTTGGTVASGSYTTASTMTSGPGNGDTGVILPCSAVQGPDADVISGVFTGAGNVVYIPVGFFPTYIKIGDWSNYIVWEWMYGAPSTFTFKDAAGADVVHDTTTAISVVADSAGGNGNVCYIKLTAGLAASSAVLSFRIEQ